MNLKCNPAVERVFHYFCNLSAIPHGSGNTKAISDYCVAFAKERGLWVHQDELNNVIIKLPATEGYEDRPTVILQGHLDMVCEKDADCDIDFTKDGLQLALDGDYLYAKGTTLGGDDGIAIAMALAIAEDTTLPHPALELVFTVDEEIGMFGAEGLDGTLLKGRTLINIDSEDEGILTVSCAGGARMLLTLPTAAAPNTLPCYRISISGLRGGHSGMEIHKGRHNSNLLAIEFLSTLSNYHLIAMEGGAKDNVIPSYTEILLAAEQDPTEIANAFALAHRDKANPDLTFKTKPIAMIDTALDDTATKQVIAFVSALPNGIQAMSNDIDDLVETSLNLGVIHCDTEKLTASFALRSSKSADKNALADQLVDIACKFGATAERSGDYPAWEYRQNSHLRTVMIELWEKLYGAKPAVAAIHAGLECGLFCEKLEGLDAVSIGPEMHEIHTARERLSLSSCERTYRYVCEIIKEL